MLSQTVTHLRQTLKNNSDAHTKKSFQRFFKERVICHGVKSAAVVKIARDYFRDVKNSSKEEIFSLCEDLLKSGYCEEAWVAANWAYWIHDRFTQGDFEVFERWINRYIDNWAECDTLCNHTVGAFIEAYPGYIKNLKTWTESKNRWMKRAAAVSLIIPAKKGIFLKDILEIAETLLTDPDDMVQKGYGWLLKEASRHHQEDVFGFVLKHRKEMPRTALRYAVEKMPQRMRMRAMEKI